jgi:acetyltransferase-like isoleucine patch superfamily enzyme
MKKKPLPIRTQWYVKNPLRVRIANSILRRWTHFWAKHSSISVFGRLAQRLACLTAPPHKAGTHLADIARCGYYIAPSATIYHSSLLLGKGVYIAERVILYQAMFGGMIGAEIIIGDEVRIMRDSILETGQGGSIEIGDKTWIHPRCQINAYKSDIKIGRRVDIAPNSALYSYNHGIEAGKWIREQPLTSKGPIIIDDEAWVGFGVIILSGVRIGKGAVIGAGSVVTNDIPENSIACGSPAKVIKTRS